MDHKKRVLVAMSGGVDSSVTAFLLQQKGYEVTGVTFNLYKQDNSQHVIDAQKVAEILNISHITMDLEEIFEKKIIQYFIQSYMKGNTPNPCAFCNRYIKFAFLEAKADELGIELIATGHYAHLTEINGNKKPSVSYDEKKSQEYFLALVPQKVLNRLLFPLHRLKKTEIREIARQNKLEFMSNKPDSQEICFLENMSYTNFLKKNINVSQYREGSIISHETQTTIGNHNGFFNYTIGQRRGIGVGIGKPQYVIDINPLTNNIIIGNKRETLKKQLRLKVLNLLDPLILNKYYDVKIRYKSTSQKSLILEIDNVNQLITIQALDFFDAPSKGQIAVFYINNVTVAATEIIEIIS